jgi:transcription elongation factor SPT4
MCAQFRQNGCENCPFLEMDKEHDNVVNCTTPNFTG